jgi:hypothetical protein
MIGRHGHDLEIDRHGADSGGLTGRRTECHALDLLVRAIRSGQSRVLVVHGEAGVGKTALLDYLNGQASGCRVCARRARSRIWNWPSPGSTSCARPC